MSETAQPSRPPESVEDLRAEIARDLYLAQRAVRQCEAGKGEMLEYWRGIAQAYKNVSGRVEAYINYRHELGEQP